MRGDVQLHCLDGRYPEWCFPEGVDPKTKRPIRRFGGTMNKMQHVHDALKVMRGPAGEAWLTHEGMRMRIRPFREGDDSEWLLVGDGPRPEGVAPDATPILTDSKNNPGGYWFPARKAFIKATRHRGGVVFGDVWWHDGRLHSDAFYKEGGYGKFRRGDDDIVLAIVVETVPS